MPGQPAARITDMHTCPQVTLVVPHVGGPIIVPCCPTVLIGKLPAARVSDMATCVGPPDQIVMGAFTTLIGKLPAARIGDLTAHGGVVTTGMVTVLIGDAPAGSPVALAGAAAAAGMSKKLNDKQDADVKEKQRREAETVQRAKDGLPPVDYSGSPPLCV